MEFTEKELAVMKLLARGFFNKEIARDLKTTEPKIDRIVLSLKGKLQAKNRLNIIAKYIDSLKISPYQKARKNYHYIKNMNRLRGNREETIAIMLANGLEWSEIASELNISVRTVQTYVQRFVSKTNSINKSHAVAKFVFFNRGLIY